MHSPFRSTWKIFKLTGEAWANDRASRLGASLAFYSVLSLGPLLLLVLVAATYIWGGDAARGQIVGEMKGIVGAQAAELIQGVLRVSDETTQRGGIIATVLGFATLLFSASSAFGELQDAMNLIWKVPPRKGRPIYFLLRDKFLAFVMVAASALLMLASLILSAVMDTVVRIAGQYVPDLPVIMPVFDFATSIIIITVLFAVMFKVIPDRRISWRGIWPAAILTAVLFIIGKMLLGVYLTHTGVASSFGAAGSLIIIMLWVYYSAQILFFGAEFAHVYAGFKTHQEGRKKKQD